MEELYQSSFGGKGTNLISADVLRRLNDYARQRSSMICNIEAFRIVGDDEVVDTGLSLYGVNDALRDLPWQDKLVWSYCEVLIILHAVEKHEGKFLFKAWCDKEHLD